MNIKQAKEQIKYAVEAYFEKDALGEFLIPPERQRPIFLIGPPGIGKTAIMEQIASELGVGLVTYSMTHHTRQSALGLPFIVQKKYGGQEYSVSEYTMSEIIASVYDRIEEDGAKQGILFLDEINCVSETLAPSMLQFLQYKVFGRHSVPDGWIVVTAGNPPEYNNSVREFDIVTWDRLKRIDVEPNFEVWKEYAYSKGVHPAVITYLEIKEAEFYSVESTVDGKRFVTARGWVDLSDMLMLFEKKHFPVTETLIVQYLQNPLVAKHFAIYYDLFNKYRSDYQIPTILAGKASPEICKRAAKAKFDERLSLLGLLLDALLGGIREVTAREQVLRILMDKLKSHRTVLSGTWEQAKERLNKLAETERSDAASGKRSGTMSSAESAAKKMVAEMFDKMSVALNTEQPTGAAVFNTIKKHFDEETAVLKKQAAEVKARLNNAFDFLEMVWQDGNEMIIFITELTANPAAAQFIGRYGCENYFAHNKELLFYERHKEIITEIESMEL